MLQVISKIFSFSDSVLFYFIFNLILLFYLYFTIRSHIYTIL